MRSWKSGERAIAKILGCERIPVTGRINKRGKPADLISPWLAVEVKTRKRLPVFLVEVMSQAEAGAAFAGIRDKKARLAIGVVHEDGDRYGESVVCLRLKDFVEHFGGAKEAAA